jgi:AraC-like DNA-binding protein
MTGGIDAGGDWSFQFEPSAGFKCVAILSGCCWLHLDAEDVTVRLEAGDFVVLTHESGYRLASDLDLPSMEIMSAVKEPLNGRVLTWQGGGDCLGLSALFSFASEHADILSEVLPPVIHIRNPEDRAVLQWYVERMMKVVRELRPGSVLLGEYLAQMMLVEVLQLHVAKNPEGAVGWLFALADPQIRAAMEAMHHAPARRWTVQELAEQAGMSRSAFAQRFKEKVGLPAMGYLTRWRMLLAADQLLHSKDSVAEIAFSLGYESESAFGFAFKREMGCSPRQYGRE